MGVRAVFLDKDGTLVKDVPYNADPARIELERGAAAALPLLRAAGYRLIVVSNQSGVARGLFNERDLFFVWQRLQELCAQAGGKLDGFYYCPHHPEAAIESYRVACQCRKPAPGMILEAAREHDIDLENSWLIGDILHDVEAGRRAGCRTILIDNGHETEWELNAARAPDFIAKDLCEAAELILRETIPEENNAHSTGAPVCANPSL